MSEPFGLLNICKPPGISSHGVVAAVRKRLGTRRVGHGGTLDPAAAGVMTVAVGKATRLLGYLRDDKRYRAVVRFGIATDTADAEGEVIAREDASRLTADQLRETLEQFRGPIIQRPPMTSAVHVKGRRLYELARAGITLAPDEIPSREITIHSLDLIGFQVGAAHLDVHCSSGTYIRSLAVDLGAALGLPACLEFLLRTCSGDCSIADAQSLEELALEAAWLPEANWLGHLATQTLQAEEISEIKFGRRIPALKQQAGPVRLHSTDGILVGLANPVGAMLQPILVF